MSTRALPFNHPSPPPIRPTLSRASANRPPLLPPPPPARAPPIPHRGVPLHPPRPPADPPDAFPRLGEPAAPGQRGGDVLVGEPLGGRRRFVVDALDRRFGLLDRLDGLAR